MRSLSRRQFIGLGLAALPAAAGIDGRFAEPTWLRLTRLDLHSQPTCRFVHFSDLHYKGDATTRPKLRARSTRLRRSLFVSRVIW